MGWIVTLRSMVVSLTRMVISLILLFLSSVLHAVPPYRIGQYHQGGVIFWLDPTQHYLHGLIADIKDQPGGNVATNAPNWASPDYSTFITRNTGAYGGKANTSAIIFAVGANAEAASLCSNSSAQDYHDWYLPDVIELTWMYINQMSITPTALEHGGSAFISVNDTLNIGGNMPIIGYWSSNQVYHNTFNAWYIDFVSGGLFSQEQNNTNYNNVRCIRAF